MTLYRAHVLDTPDDPFCGGRLRADADAGLLDPELCSPLEVGLRHAVVTADTLANVFALATSADSARVWV